MVKHGNTDLLRDRANAPLRPEWTLPQLVRLGALGDVAGNPHGGPPGQTGCHPVKGCNWQS